MVVLSPFFDFTEWSHDIINLNHPKKVKERWIYSNSSHVLDLAFYLGGRPKKLKAINKGSTIWHSKGSIYSGCGITNTGAIFNYGANWNSAGRWKLEFLTEKNKYIFEPIEKLKVMKKGTIKIKDIDTKNSKYDLKYKPGIYLQTKNFLKNNNEMLCSIELHSKKMKIYKKIAGY